MNLTDMATVIGLIVTASGAFFAMLRFMIKHYLNELKPNGGSSIKDQVNRLEARVDTIIDMLSAGK